MYFLLETSYPNIIGFGYKVAMLYQQVIAFVCCIFLTKSEIKFNKQHTSAGTISTKIKLSIQQNFNFKVDF